MDHTRLGTSGLKISRIALGCMSFGDTASGFNSGRSTRRRPQPYFRQAVELGITFWDTANVYSLGTSEEFVGRAIRATPAARTSYSPPRSTSACTMAGRFRACPGRRSWSRSTPR